MEKLTRYNCYALQIVFMKVSPFPWQETIDCLGSLLNRPYSKLALHKCMHNHGTHLFNYWRRYLLLNVKNERVQLLLRQCLTPIREYSRGVWMIKETDQLHIVSEGRKWYSDIDQCIESTGSVPPSFDQPDSYPMELIFTMETKCYNCTQREDDKCLCRVSIHCPIRCDYSFPLPARDSLSALTTKNGITYYYSSHHTREDNLDHFMINGTYLCREVGQKGLEDAQSLIDYYIVTTDEWFSSLERNPVLAFDKFIMEDQGENCQCWNERCPCNVQ